ncbi:hypothetical protein H0H93_012497 [Arthromyces matolae]|nr:hypothetical protein H0H93_012497 [Arthromyces matolae]
MAPPRHSNRLPVAHPYARLYAKKDEVKRRKIWNHALEKSLFTPFEISTIGAPQRRTIYIASLEAHIDKLHDQLHEFVVYLNINATLVFPLTVLFLD